MNKNDVEKIKTNHVRFNINKTKYFDVQLINNELKINCSSCIKLMPTGGCNCIKIVIKE